MPINYDNKYVIRPNSEVEYTKEDIKELYRCSKDINAFIPYIRIINLDQGEIPFVPHDYQHEMINLFANTRYSVILASRQSGKCVRTDTIIKIRNKTTGKVEEISIGNFLQRVDNSLSPR